MDEQKRASVLEDLAADASRRRDQFLDDAGRKFVRFLDTNKSRLKDLGGLVLIDDEPDYLFISEEGTFRSRTRYQDTDGEWISETEEIEDGEELVEIFNPADLYAAFVDAAQAEAQGEEAEDEDDGTADADEADADEADADEADADEADADEADADEADADEADADAAEEEVVGEKVEDDEPGLYEWLGGAPLAPKDQQDAARLMYDLALTFQEGSQFEQAQLIDDFQAKAAPAAELLGDSKFVEDEDERLWLRSNGAIEGEVVPAGEEEAEAEPDWQPLTTSDQMVQFYDPTDLFGDLAEAIAESYPEVAPEVTDDVDGPSDEDRADED